MGENVFVEYSRFIEDIKVEILSLQSLLRIDGKLAKEQYAFLHEYAAIDERGMISKSIVKDSYLKKRDILQNIFESVRIHSYFKSLDEFTKKEELIQLVTKVFMVKIKEQKNDKTAEELERQKNDFIQRVYKSNNDQLICLIDLFFGTDVYYYKWYYRKDMANELESGFIYDEHKKTTNDLNDNVILYEGLVREQNGLLEQKSSLVKNLSDFTKSIINFDFRSHDDTGVFHNVWKFLKGKKDNKEILYGIFCEVSMIDGALKFYRKLSGTHSIINIFYCFNKYFEETYGKDVSFVEVEVFLKDFINAIITFYQEEIAKIDELLVQKQIDIGVKGEILLQMADVVKKGASIQRDMFLTQIDEFDYKIKGFTDEEEKRIFEDMKEYLVLNGNRILNIEDDFKSPLLNKMR